MFDTHARAGLFAVCLCTMIGCTEGNDPGITANTATANTDVAAMAVLATRSPGVGVSAAGACTDAALPGFAEPLRTFYVDARTGNDNDDGLTQKKAWRTLAKANIAARPGDLVLLTGRFVGQYIRPDSSGTAAHKIVFRAGPGAAAVLDGGAYDVALWLDGRRYIVVDGLEVKNAAYAILLRDGASNIWLRNLDVHDVATAGVQILQSSDNRFENSTMERCGAAADNSGDCIWIADGSSRNVIARNSIVKAGHGTIFIGGDQPGMAPSLDNVVVSNDLSNPWASNVGLIGFAVRTVVECNKIHDSSTSKQNYARSGVQITAQSNIVRFNEIYDNTADGIQIQGYDFHGMSQDATGNQVYNNSVWDNGGAGLQLLQKDLSQVKDNVIENNIFWSNNSALKTNQDSRFYNGSFQDIWVDLYNATTIWPAGSLNGNIIRYNILVRDAADVGKGWLIIVRKAVDGDNSYYTMAQAEAAFSGVTHNMQKDPLFVKSQKDDVELRSQSPAIDAGLAVFAVPFRGAAPDLGAHELR